MFLKKFFYFWLHWVLSAACGIHLALEVCVLEFVLSVFRLEEGSPVWVIVGGWGGLSQAGEEAAPSVTREVAPRGRPRQRRGLGSAASLHPAMGQPGADGWASGASVGLPLPASGARHALVEQPLL